MEYIDEHYMEELNCADCARKFHMSQSNIARLCKKYLNMSFTEFYNDVRVRKAKEMLEEGVPIKDAAASVGYRNLNYFYRIFKKSIRFLRRNIFKENSRRIDLWNKVRD